MCENCERELAQMQKGMEDSRKKMLGDDHLGPFGDRYVPMAERPLIERLDRMACAKHAAETLINGTSRLMLINTANNPVGGAFFYVGLSSADIPASGRKFQCFAFQPNFLFYLGWGRFRIALTGFDMHRLLDLYSTIRLQMSRILYPAATDFGENMSNPPSVTPIMDLRSRKPGTHNNPPLS